jgi:hypothetical protein
LRARPALPRLQRAAGPPCQALPPPCLSPGCQNRQNGFWCCPAVRLPAWPRPPVAAAQKHTGFPGWVLGRLNVAAIQWQQGRERGEARHQHQHGASQSQLDPALWPGRSPRLCALPPSSLYSLSPACLAAAASLPASLAPGPPQPPATWSCTITTAAANRDPKLFWRACREPVAGPHGRRAGPRLQLRPSPSSGGPRELLLLVPSGREVCELCACTGLRGEGAGKNTLVLAAKRDHNPVLTSLIDRSRV